MSGTPQRATARHPVRTAVPWPVRRRGVDILRFGLAVVVLSLAALGAHLGRPTVVEVNLFRLINELPSPLGAPLLGVMQLGALGAAVGIAAVIVVAGRSRLALAVACAGIGGWAASKILQHVVDEEPSRLHIPQVLLHGNVSNAPGLAFPASHVAVAAAMTLAASPYLGQPARRLCWFIVGMVAVARVYVGLHLPVDVVGGLALGIAVGSLANLVLGVPVRGPTGTQLRALLAAAGLAPVEVESLPDPDHQRCRTADGRDLLVKTIVWDQPDQGWLSRLWRLIAFRESSDPTRPSSPGHRTAHEAHVTLLAERGGVRTPALVLAHDMSHQTGIVVREWVDATPLPELRTADVTDGVLVDAWCQMETAHRAGIILRHVDPRRLLVDADGRVWLVGWGAAALGTAPADQDADRAEMAVILAGRVGAERALAAAAEALGDGGPRIPLAHLQPLALGAEARRVVTADPSLLMEVRAEVAELEGVEAPPPVSPTRVAAANLLPVVGLALAVYVLLPSLARSSTSVSTLRHAQWPWLLGAVAGGTLTYVMSAIALMAAAGRPLSFGRTFVVQLAAASTNRVVPGGLGAAATNVRYLELAGLERPEAVTAIGLTAAAGVMTHVVATTVAVAALRSRAVSLHVPDLDATWPRLLILGLACVAIGWVVWARRFYRPVVRWGRAAIRSVGSLATHPQRLVVLIAANAGVSIGYILALAATLAAFGVHPGLGTVAGVYLGAAAVGGLAPTPGGVGPFEAAAVAALGGLGVAAGPAVAAIITYRLITYWLPVAPGIVALQRLRRRGML